MHALYMERIYDKQKGACHGYLSQDEPGSVEEYGERYSCFYKHNGNEDFHFIFLGWWQGSVSGTMEEADNRLEYTSLT